MNICLKSFVDEKFKKPGKALDLGAGDFFDVACMRQLNWECEGVDINMGIDLEEPYESRNKPFDLVYSNYLLHKLKNKQQFIGSVHNNLKSDGWIFIHTFDKSDGNSYSGMTAEEIKELLVEGGFKNISTKVFDFYDNDEGHKHWHKILEATAQK